MKNVIHTVTAQQSGNGLDMSAHIPLVGLAQSSPVAVLWPPAPPTASAQQYNTGSTSVVSPRVSVSGQLYVGLWEGLAGVAPLEENKETELKARKVNRASIIWLSIFEDMVAHAKEMFWKVWISD